MGMLHSEIPLTTTVLALQFLLGADEVKAFRGQTTRALCILPDFIYGIC
jgi:hypothetical protein